MPVTKTMRECYEVRENGEWATISLDCWERPANAGTPHERTYYCGEITIQSSFGTWGHVWTACGEPFKQFLASLSFDYVFTKFMGTKLDRYDGEGTLREIKKDILRRRREAALTHNEARDVWGAVMDESERIESDETSCGYALMEIASNLSEHHQMRDNFADPMAWVFVTRHDSQAVGFWRDLWPAFVGALKAEMQPAMQAA